MEDKDLISLTAGIVAAYVEHNSVPASDLPTLIASVHAAVKGVDAPEVTPQSAATKATPAQIKRSIQPNGLINFEDGKAYKSLKRNLATKGLTPDQYRAKWGLPKDYPMVSPAYSAARSALAKEMGLGKGGATSTSSGAAAAKRRSTKARAAPAGKQASESGER